MNVHVIPLNLKIPGQVSSRARSGIVVTQRPPVWAFVLLPGLGSMAQAFPTNLSAHPDTCVIHCSVIVRTLALVMPIASQVSAMRMVQRAIPVDIKLATVRSY